MQLTIKDRIKLVLNLKEKFQGKKVAEIISLSYEEFGENMAVTTAFGYSGIVLLSFLKEVIPKIPIYFIDTRLHFEETMKLLDKIKKEWNLNIQCLYPSFSEEELEKMIGKEIYKVNPDICCYYRKVEPLLRILKTKVSWLTAIRKDQSITRNRIGVVEIDDRGIIKINPLYDWTRDQIWTYIRKYDLPYNLLHDQYYPSIGCKPCTVPVDKGGCERNGRWQGFQKQECKIHLYDSKEKCQNVIF